MSRLRLGVRLLSLSAHLATASALILAIGGSARAANIISEEGFDLEPSEKITTFFVFDEPHILEGAIFVELSNEFVNLDSVVVTNVSNTMIFEPGQDYSLVGVGTRTEIGRLPFGVIADGDTVLVDYSYVPEPSTATLLALGLVGIAAIRRKTGSTTDVAKADAVEGLF
jgi:hypothetical protein